MKSIRLSHCRYVPWLFSAMSFFFISYSVSSQNASSSSKIFASNSYTVPLKLNEVRNNAARHFRNHFSANGAEKWYKVDQFYMASFTDGNMLTKAYYTSRGFFSFCVKYYAEELLNPDIRFSIMKKFEGYKIDVVTEISNPEHKIYFINIKNSAHIKTLCVTDENIEVTQDLLNGEI